MENTNPLIPDDWEVIDLPEMLLVTTSFQIPVLVNEVIAQIGGILKVNNSTIIRAGILMLLQNIIIKENPTIIIAPPFMRELIRIASNPNTSHPLNLDTLITTLFPIDKPITGDNNNG